MARRVLPAPAGRQAVQRNVAPLPRHRQPEFQRLQFLLASDKISGAKLGHQQFAQIAWRRLQAVARQQVQGRPPAFSRASMRC